MFRSPVSVLSINLLRIHYVLPRSTRNFAGLRDATQTNVDLFAVLEVNRNASPTQIKKQFYQKAKTLHPDVLFNTTGVAGSDNRHEIKKVEAKFIQLTHAYEVLSDPKSRALYVMQYDMAQRRHKQNLSEFRHGQYYRNADARHTRRRSRANTGDFEQEEVWGFSAGEMWGWNSKSGGKVREDETYFDGTTYQTYPGLVKRGQTVFDELRQEYDEVSGISLMMALHLNSAKNVKPFSVILRLKHLAINEAAASQLPIAGCPLFFL
jgi:hypothetical protein